MNEDLKNCLETLQKGGIILYPTDTVWGIGCDATNEEAVQKVFKVKQRSESKSMIVLLADAADICNYADFLPAASHLIEKAQSPLTIIYPNAMNLAPSIIGPDGSIAIRIVKDEFCSQLIKKLKKPLVSSSANISGEEAPAGFSGISHLIKDGVDYVVKWRQEEENKNTPSSIIRVHHNGTIEVIRV